MAKRDKRVNLPDDFEETLRDLLATDPDDKSDEDEEREPSDEEE